MTDTCWFIRWRTSSSVSYKQQHGFGLIIVSPINRFLSTHVTMLYNDTSDQLIQYIAYAVVFAK